MANASSKQVSIKNFVKVKEESSSSIVNLILDHLIRDIIDNTIHTSKCKKHTGGVQLMATTAKDWTSKYPWLEIKSETVEGGKRLFCQMCKDAKKSNKMATSGSLNTQISTIKKHDASFGKWDLVGI